MDRSEVITLVSTTYTRDANGVKQKSESTRDVFCEVSSVGMTEWFEGNRSNLNPQYVFTMYDFEYEGERTVIYNNIRYSVFRTYRKKNESIELHVQKESGA